jgi:Galactose oxidase, central domain/Kelch motif
MLSKMSSHMSEALPRNMRRLFALLIVAPLSACGGSGGGATPTPPATVTYTATSGLAEKGPLIKGSTVTAQQLDAGLSPTGQQFTYQVTTDFGSFSPTSTFTSRYIGLNASGYYFDEVQNAVSSSQITLNGYNDLTVDTALNVNLLTTLAYQRIQKLVSVSGMTFAAARTQAEGEVLAALNIPRGSCGAFGSLDLSGSTDGDHILAAASSLFVYRNSGATLSELIAEFQSDLGANGIITNTTTQAALTNAAKQLDPAAVAANLTAEFNSEGLAFTASDITDWLATAGDGVIGKFSFQATHASPTTVFTFPSFVTAAFAGKPVSATAGELSVNGAPVSGPVTINAGDTITLSPGTSPFSAGALTAYLISGSTDLAKVTYFTAGIWTSTGSLSTVRAQNTATLLPDGTVLVAGGHNPSPATASLASAEIYDPAAGTWSPTGSLATGRSDHTATLLPDGKVLVAGGFAGVPESELASAEIYDPVSKLWSSTGNLATARAGQTATLLANGTVLIAGGFGSAGALNSAELYDPTAGTWAATGNLSVARTGHTATLLLNGAVLVASGSSAEIYNPTAGAWTPTGSLATARTSFTATLLPNGTVLVAGGATTEFISAASAEIYDPTAGTWAPTGNLINARSSHSAARLPNGSVLVAGGYQSGYLASSEVYDPVAHTWSTVGSLNTARYEQTATLLNNGTVLVAGGSAGGALASAEVYH